jgi:hypothetical protein
MTTYTFTNEAGTRFIWNTDRKITTAVIFQVRGLDSFQTYFQVYGNKGAAVSALDSALYAHATDIEVVSVNVATQEQLDEYVAQQEAAWALFQSTR